MNEYREKSKKIWNQACQIIDKHCIDRILEPHGKVLYAGSFAMKLMMWKDIDLNLVIDTKIKSFDNVGKELVSMFISNNKISRIKIYKDLHMKYGHEMPKSLYVGLDVDGWKFDIHVVDKEEACKTEQKTNHVLTNLDEEKKDLILSYKFDLCEKYGRCPKFSSFYLYKAVIDNEYSCKKNIDQYLKQHNIKH